MKLKVKDADQLGKELANPENKTIMTTLQKFATDKKIFCDKKIIVLTDESHRTQYKKMATKMRAVLPNGVFFAFTATPIDKPPNRKTFDKFGDEIDIYTWEESKKDGATIDIIYKGRRPDLYVDPGKDINDIFDKVFARLTKEQRDKIRSKFGTRENIEKAPHRIKLIAENIVDHYNKSIGINSFKAMLVTSSKEAAVRYKRAIDDIPGAPKSIIIMTSELGDKGEDGESWDKYYIPSNKREEEAEKFASPSNENQIVIVVDMLLTGYDAPIVQAMYLDHRLTEHTLLQAVARVNRNYANKKYGYIIDYCGITKELKEAQEMFDEIKTRGLITPEEELLKRLEKAHKRVMENISDINPKNHNEIIVKFSDPAKRDRFWQHFKDFEKALDAVMPEPEALKFTDDLKLLAEVKQIIKNWLERDEFSTTPYSKKVQEVIDKHIKASDIPVIVEDTKLDENTFLVQIGKKFDDKRARAALAKDRATSVLREKKPDNPAFYETLEEQLNNIIEDEKERRIDDAKVFEECKKIIQAALGEEKERRKLGFENGFEFSLYGKLEKIKKDSEKSKQISKEIFKEIFPETRKIDWKKKTKVEKTMKEIIYDKLANMGYTVDGLEKIVDEIIELVKRLLK